MSEVPVRGREHENEHKKDRDNNNVLQPSAPPSGSGEFKEVDISVTQKMLSAVTGSILTSILVTPLDVVRVRLQSQHHTQPLPKQNLAPSLRPPPFINIPPSLGVTACCREVFWVTNTADYCVAAPQISTSSATVSSLSSTSSATSSTAATTPVTDCAVEETKRRTFNSTLDGLRKIARNEGLSTLWRGLSPTLVMAVPANVIYFTGYDWLRTNPHSLIKRNVSDTYSPLVAGSFARVLAAIFVSPIELFRTRMQASSTPRSSMHVATSTSSSTSAAASQVRSPYRDTFASLRQLVASQGYMALWRGLGLTLWRDVPFSALYWWGYEAGRHTLAELRGRSSSDNTLSVSSSAPDRTAPDNTITLIDSFLAGATSGAVAALLTTPFDVGKTRQQVVRDSTLSSSPSSSRTTSTSTPVPKPSDPLPHHSPRPEQLSMPRFLGHIFREQGLPGLFRGWAARCLKVAPACAIMISSYELGKSMAW